MNLPIMARTTDEQITGRADEELLAAAAAGEEPAFTQLYRRHARRIYARLCRLTGPGRHLEDLLQQTFFQVHRSLGGFRGESRFDTWLTRIAINTALQHLRTARRKPAAELGLVASDQRLGRAAPQPTSAAAARAWQLLDELPEDLRTVFVLRDVEEMTLAEISAATSTPISTVSHRVGQARRQIARLLRQRERGQP